MNKLKIETNILHFDSELQAEFFRIVFGFIKDRKLNLEIVQMEKSETLTIISDFECPEEKITVFNIDFVLKLLNFNLDFDVPILTGVQKIGKTKNKLEKEVSYCSECNSTDIRFSVRNYGLESIKYCCNCGSRKIISYYQEV